MSLGLGSVVVVGLFLAFNYWLAIARPNTLRCEPGEMCHIDSPVSRFNRALFWTSLAIYIVALVATYGAEWWILRS